MSNRKQGSTLEPVVLRVTVPSLVPIDEDAIAQVRLLLSEKSALDETAVIDEQIAAEDWSWDPTAGQLTLTWYPSSSELEVGQYHGEVWIYDNEGRILKTPSVGLVPITVRASLVRQP